MAPEKYSLLGNNVTKVFVSGGAGFIGSHVVDELMRHDYQVTVYDNLSSGRAEFIKQHFGKKNFRWVQADLLDVDRLTESISGQDLVWHLAANTDIPGGYHRTDIDIKHCVMATYNIVEAMRKTHISTLLFSSTGAVYGALCHDDAASECAGPLLPVSLYAAGKIASEAFISAYCSLFGLRACIFRFGNVLGGRMGHGVVYDFIQKLRRNPQELEILGDGRQEKNYFLVEECIDGMAYAFRHAPLTEKKPCEIFNLGTDSVSNVRTIAKIISEEMKLKDVKLKIAGGDRSWPGDQPRVHITVDRMRQLGWTAKLHSDDAVRIATRRMLDACS